MGVKNYNYLLNLNGNKIKNSSRGLLVYCLEELLSKPEHSEFATRSKNYVMQFHTEQQEIIFGPELINLYRKIVRGDFENKRKITSKVRF